MSASDDVHWGIRPWSPRVESASQRWKRIRRRALLPLRVRDGRVSVLALRAADRGGCEAGVTPSHRPCRCCPDKDQLQHSVARQTLLFAQGGIECLDRRLIEEDYAFVCVDEARLFALQQPGSGDAQAIIVATGSTRAEELLDFIGSILGAEPEQCFIEGANLVLSSGAPARTIAEAGLGTIIKAGKLKRAAILSAPVHRISKLPWCPICLSAPSSPRYVCRAVSPHSYCAACASRYALTTLVSRTFLRCPMHGCDASMETSALEEAAARAGEQRAARMAEQSARLRRVRTGLEGPEMARLVRSASAVRPCPNCAVLIFKDGGCSHVSCGVCGTSFDWTS